jgi:hypothetical protein
MTLLDCFFGGEGGNSNYFEKLPRELITIILNYVNPEYVYIEKYSDHDIKSLDQYEEILKALIVADAVCENNRNYYNVSSLDTVGYVHRILTNQYYIIKNKMEYFEFVKGNYERRKKCERKEKKERKNIKIAFQILNINVANSCFRIPKIQDLYWLWYHKYIQFSHQIF